MKRVLTAIMFLALFGLWAGSASSQSFLPTVVATCGTQSLSNQIGRPFHTFMDTTGEFCTSGSGGGGGSNASVGLTGAAVPGSGTYIAFSGAGGLLTGVSTANPLPVTGGGSSTVDEAGFTAGTSLFTSGGGFFQTTATANPLTNGQQGLFQVTAQRALFENLRNSSGAEVGLAAAPLFVSPGTGATFVVGGAAAQGATASGNPILRGGIFNTTQPTVANGQVVTQQMTARGAAIVATGLDSLNSTLFQGGNALGATNGLYTNLLQGNALLTATNTIFSAISTGGLTALVTTGTPTAGDSFLEVGINPNGLTQAYAPGVNGSGNNIISGQGVDGGIPQAMGWYLSTLTGSITPASSAHAQNTCIGTVQSLTSAVRNSAASGSGTAGRITAAMLGLPLAVSGPQIDMEVYTSTPATSPCADAAAYNLVLADVPKRIATIHLYDPSAATATTGAQSTGLAADFSLVSSTTLFYQLVNRGASITVPASPNNVFNVTLQDVKN